jgi:hypothetical protein
MESIILLAAPQGAGKSLAADLLEQHFTEWGKDVRVEEMSDFVRSEWQDSGVDISLAEWAGNCKEEYGDFTFADGLADTIVNDFDSDVVIVSGIRLPAEVDIFEARFDCAVRTIAIWTLPDLRFKRKHGEPVSEDHEMWEQFQYRDKQELYEWDCASMYAADSPHTADHIIPNNGDVPSFRARLKAVSMDWGVYTDTPFPHGDVERVQQYL